MCETFMFSNCFLQLAPAQMSNQASRDLQKSKMAVDFGLLKVATQRVLTGIMIAEEMREELSVYVAVCN